LIAAKVGIPSSEPRELEGKSCSAVATVVLWEVECMSADMAAELDSLYSHSPRLNSETVADVAAELCETPVKTAPTEMVVVELDGQVTGMGYKN
jgi:hypothetical protein